MKFQNQLKYYNYIRNICIYTVNSRLMRPSHD